MCGITGIWNFNQLPIDINELDRFTDSLSHRGPDGRGAFIDKISCIGLGHRRLSILDLTEFGKQPMSYLDNRYHITFNGEIFNFIELKAELKSIGYNFRTNTDTEVILAAYIEWGEECQFKFNGMWSFAIWDSNKRNLFLSRDRFGIKPLFYIHTKDYFIFASELKAFKFLSASKSPDFNFKMIANMSNIENSTETILNGVNNLNGGFQINVESSGNLKVKKWWRTKDHVNYQSFSNEEYIDQYKELFFDSCKIRMRSDVSLGTALSGGLDSSAVHCAMGHLNKTNAISNRSPSDWQKAFILNYSNTSHSEVDYAKQVTDFVGSEPIIKDLTFHKDFVDDILKSIYSFEAIQEPMIGPWALYKTMREHGIVVSIDGHGGDESLAGYIHHPKVAMFDHLSLFKNKKRFNELCFVLDGFYDGQVSRDLAHNQIDSRLKFYNFILKNKKYLKSSSFYNNYFIREILELFQSGFKSLSKNSGDQWRKINRSTYAKNSSDSLHGNKYDSLNRQLYIDFHDELLPRILRNFDRLSMAHGVEIRAPFLDWRLVTFAFSIPSHLKLGEGFSKLMLRKSMSGIIPESIRLRKNKIGFASPMSEWYKNLLKPLVLDSINSSDFLNSEIWNGPFIREYVENCYRKNEMKKASKSWKFIQAMLLMQSFNQKGDR